MSDDSKSDNNITSSSLPERRPEKNSELAFSRIKTDLKSALDQWETLSKAAPKKSADEQRLLEMQQLLIELKSKMDELNF